MRQAHCACLCVIIQTCLTFHFHAPLIKFAIQSFNMERITKRRTWIPRNKVEDSERKESLLSKFSCHVFPQTPAAIKHFEKVLNSIGFNHQEEVTSLECIGDGPLSFNVKIGMKLYSKTRNMLLCVSIYFRHGIN